MRIRVLARVLGILICFIGVAMAATTLYAWIDFHYFDNSEKSASAFKPLLIATGITVFAGVAMFFSGSGRGEKRDLLRREAIIIVGLSWILCALFGALPFVLLEGGLNPVEAFFESMSGFTTTGASVMRDIESFPRSILLWRAVTQWLGGIGILVLFVAVLSFLGVGSRSLMQQESSLNISESTASRIGDTAMTLLKVYIGLTLLCGLGLWAMGMPAFDAVCHSFATLSTGGFSTKNASIGHYNHLGMEVWLTVFMLLGSISFMLYVFIIQGKKKRIKAEEEARYYILLLVIAGIFVATNLAALSTGMGFLQGLRESFFMIVSISSTTGFGTTDYDQWPAFSRIVLLVLMIIGGCAGSTAGGVKMNRIILFWKISTQELVRSYRPNQIFRLKLNGVAPDNKVLVQTSFFLANAFIVAGIAMMAVSALEPDLDFVSVLGGVFGNLFNIGPGLGDLGPTDNYADLSSPTLLLMVMLMALGRLEFVAILVLFMPSLWKKY